MGTDIHVYPEILGKSGWEPAAKFDHGEFYSDRDYAVFAILANVRNHNGQFKSIANPRGMPADCSIHEALYQGMHDVSWLTLDEIEAWPWWDTAVKRSGIVDMPGFRAWLRQGAKGPPDMYAASVFGDHVFILPMGDALQYCAASREDQVHIVLDLNLDRVTLHVRAEWTKTYREIAGRFLARMELLRGLVRDPRDARIVFGFDS